MFCLEHGHAHLFMNSLWLISLYNAEFSSCDWDRLRTYAPQTLNFLPIRLLQRMFADCYSSAALEPWFLTGVTLPPNGEMWRVFFGWYCLESASRTQGTEMVTIFNMQQYQTMKSCLLKMSIASLLGMFSRISKIMLKRPYLICNFNWNGFSVSLLRILFAEEWGFRSQVLDLNLL